MKKIVYLIPLFSIGLINPVCASYEDNNENSYNYTTANREMNSSRSSRDSNMTPTQYRNATNRNHSVEESNETMYSKQSLFLNKEGETNRRPTNYNNRARWDVNNTWYNRF